MEERITEGWREKREGQRRGGNERDRREREEERKDGKKEKVISGGR